ncbi:MAG: xanthine dehydrogenase accessory factor, partial [Colwellia sp.]
MKINWTGAVHQLNKQGKAYVVATIVGVTGSTPRNSGTKMVITNEDIFDTIGGGHLEHKVIKHAHQLLISGEACQQLEHFQLGAQLGQCCGGDASVLFECFSASGANIMLFGAGHVGKALIPILAGLPCSITWVDNRAEQFPDDIENYSNVTAIISDNPAEEVATMPANSYFIVMTHNHQLDFEISHNILKRADFAYSGLIASDTKWRRFQQRFQHRDIEKSLVDKMNCPIGLAQVQGKLPMEVAVSVAGEIIELYQAKLAEKTVANP